MVFEKTLSSVLNRFLGDYVENLNGHQLNVGIWGGDVELKYLALKPSALDDLELPIQTIAGTIETLILKIPWKSLYTSPTVICIEDIYLLAVPNHDIKYDPDKEEKKIIEAKNKAIQKFEEAKKAEEEKGKPKADATFVEKLVTTIIKNVQLEIKRVHIRYEDKVTNPGVPFAFGITLNELAVESTDSTWKKGKDDDLSKIYKVVRLEGLSVYWNCGTRLIGRVAPGALTYQLSKFIATKDSSPPGYSYILGPINASARLRMSPKPENDTPEFSIPKIHLNLDMEKLFIGISKTQYRDIIALVDTLDRMAKGSPYRKFRPDVKGYKQNYKAWWQFAYQSVLSDVRRKRADWQWSHMHAYRQMCWEYKELYKKKITGSLTVPDKERIDVCEKLLDITNIVIIRQRIEMEIERSKEVPSEKKSWFGWMWGSSSKDDVSGKQKAAAILKELQEEVTPEEKAKLYKAIDYQENTGPEVYPLEYVDNSSTFLLRTLEVVLRDDDSEIKTILTTELTTVRVKLETRAAASAIKVHVKVDDLMTVGMRQDDFVPNIITSETADKTGLLEVQFETNPLDGQYDQKLSVVALPIKIIYDAKTINKAIEIFKVPEDTSLQQIQAVADSSMSNVKEMTSTGLQFAIEKHVRLDLHIDLHAPYIIIPHGGVFTDNENVLVVNLGRLKMFSFGKHSTFADVKLLHEQGIAQKDILKVMKEHSYENFQLELTDLQILVAQSDEDWKGTLLESTTSEMHLLNPLSMAITYSKCLIVDDPGMPHHKIKGSLPSIDINISEARLMLLVSLATSIPQPTTNEPPPLKPLTPLSKGSSTMLLKYKELQETARLTRKIQPALPADSKGEFAQLTVLEAKFEMSELSVSLNQQPTLASAVNELVSFKIKGVELKLAQQTYTTNVSLLLGGISLQQYRDGQVINIISTPITSEGEEYLFKVQFTQVDAKCPELHSVYKSCESSLTLNFGVLGVILHQEGLLTLIKFGTDIQKDVMLLLEDRQGDRIATTRRMSVISEHLSDIHRVVTSSAKRKKVPVVVETIKFKLKANLQEVSVRFTTDRSNISSWAIRGINTDIIVKHTYTQINSKLDEIAVIDLNPETVHRLILSGTEGVALTTQIVINNLDDKSNKPDMDITVKMGGMRIIFLNRFLMTMLQFLNQFQVAEQKIIEASQAAAQSAKDNMKEAYNKATKISLNINVKAPDIIVPVDSKSYDALFLDLGIISLSNKFLTLDMKSAEGFAAVIDDLKVSLSQLKISRITLDKNYKIIWDCSIVEPITFDIAIKRNLSSSWYTSVPDIDISGKIKVIEFLLSQADFQMVMSILSGNLTENQQEKVHADKSVYSTGRTEALVTGVQTVDVHEKAKQARIFLNFAFRMEQLIINLYTGGLKSTDVTNCHNPDCHLARFSLEGLALRGRILTDDSIVMSVVLVNCLLDDMRKGREHMLRRLIERSPDSEVSTSASSSSESVAQPPKSMIDVILQQKASDTFADIRIYSFTVILSVDYMLKLADFFSTTETVQLQSKQTQTTGVTVKSSRATTLPTPAPPTTQKETQLTVNLKLEKPDIILVEHMDNINTDAMILNSEILVKFRMAGPHQVLNGAITDLQVYTCNYNPALRATTRANILHPVTISLAGSTPEDKGLHVELLVNSIRLSVSPATIELLNRVLVTMTSSEASRDEDAKKHFNYENIWKQKPFVDPDYWFLKTEFGADVLEEEIMTRSVIRTPLQELCIISMPSIVVTIEAGVGNKTLPMLMLDASFKGSARNWTSQLSMDASLTLQMGYYNSRLALWEPLIEPIEIMNGRGERFLPWELKLELSMNEQEDVTGVLSPTSDSEGDAPVQPVMSIDVTSENNLEITVTKTSLEVLNNLGKAFASAMQSKTMTSVTTTEAAYKVLNEIGEDVTLLLEQSSFRIADGGCLDDINKSAAVPLQLKSDAVSNNTLQLGKELISNTLNKDLYLHVKINSKNCELALPVVRADKRFFMLNYRGGGHDNWGIVSDVKIEEGVTVITLRTVLQVYNHFNVPVDVYYMTPRDNELELIGSVQPAGALNLPLKAVYSPTCELFYAVSGYSITCSPYIWKDLRNSLTVTKLLQCPKRDNTETNGPFVMKVVGEIEQIYFENTSRHTMASACYNIHLRPAVIFKNCLPLDIVCCVDELAEEFTVEAGETLQLPTVNPGKNVLVIRLPEYLEKEWSCRNSIVEEPQEFSIWTFNSYDSPTKMSLNLGMHTLDTQGSLLMTLYCPFWMLNKTGLMIGYRSPDDVMNVLHHPAHFKGPILFSFNTKNFFGKKKASIRVESGEWSDKFSLDAAGSAGMVTCKANDRVYQIGIHNQLTYNNLTKQVTIMPYYVVINNAPFPIECQESDRPADPWTEVQPESCSALWSRSELEDKLLKIRVFGTNEVSAPFLYTESHNTLLRLNNKYGGINVDIQMTEGAVYISFAPYENGSAPALLVNHTNFTITYWEKNSVQKRTLLPKNSILYSWENPSGPRMLAWDKGHNSEILSDLRKDDYGEFKPAQSEESLYWVTFLDGMQRVLLFTQDKTIALGAQTCNLLEVIQQDITVSIHGLGLSLVNNLTRQEVMYVGIASSGVIWEVCRMNGRRYKQLATKESTHIEAAYQQYMLRRNDVDADEDESDHVIVDGKTMIDFRLGIMSKPQKRKIRRTFQTGLWIQMKNSPSQMQFHAKVNRLQIDNQMFDCIFPVVLAPVPPPKSVAADSGIKPFMEVSVVQLLMKNSQVRQFKYFKVLVQEFHIKVDMGFVNAICCLLEESAGTEEDEKQRFLTDMKLVNEPLYTHVSSQSMQEQKSFYDLLHFSPLKIHISFSMAAGSSAGPNPSTPNFLTVLLQGIGVSLTDLNDIIFKLAFFERNYTFLTQKQLVGEATSHYIGQSVKQLYVLVLGLDVIGNPYGLVVGIGKGVEDLFYEPFQGAIQGPDEFAEGLALGMRSLFGHTVGGAAGAMSRITGAMGKGIAALTFDDEYQRKRRDQLKTKPSTVQEGMARSGKGLVMGVYSGVTGVFTKPVAGAREQGVEGFFKGLGKGAVGLVTRPVAGVVDFASGSLDVVKRAAECVEDTGKLRPPRYLQGDGLVRPYNLQEAEGNKLLNDLHKGKYAATDIYVAHYVVIHKKEILLLTNKRIAYICHNDIFGGWQVEWSYTWEELQQPSRVVPKGVLITTSERKKKLFGSSDVTKTILIGDPSLKEEICLKIESLRGS